VSQIDPEHFIQALRFDIKTRDRIKAELVLAHWLEMDEDTQELALAALYNAPDAFTIAVLVGLFASQKENASIGLKELLFSKALDNPDILIDLIRREVKPACRILLAEIAGEIKLDRATPVLLSILAERQNEETLRGIIAALGMIGDPAAIVPISEFLYSGHEELVIATVQALGQIGTPAAIQRLSQKLGSDPNLDKMIIDIVTYSQEPEALNQLNATLSARHAHLRNAGKQKLVDIGPKAVPVLISNLDSDDSDLLIHTINVLAHIGDESAIAPIRKLLYNEPGDPNVRFCAYEALGQLPIAKGAFALAQGLSDPVKNVRSAAASAINHNYNTVLAAGIKNMIRDEKSVERPISRTIIDAECDNIFLDLINHAAFREYAVEYLSKKAHGDTRAHYVELLCAHGNDQVVAAIEGQVVIDKRPTPKVFAVDDSKMILNIYRAVLHNLGCAPLLFEFPALAIEAVKISMPDLIFTDLNMPNISGIELTRAVRRLFSKEELPIIMVTTQNEYHDNDAAYRAGINMILNKPFDEDVLKAAMEAQLHREAA
jgi:CheY-like chemotaxis protein